MSRKRKFSGTSKSRTFYDRKVLRHGSGAQISVGYVLPKSWRYVRITPVWENGDTVWLEVHKLLGAEINAEDTKKRGDIHGKKD